MYQTKSTSFCVRINVADNDSIVDNKKEFTCSLQRCSFTINLFVIISVSTVRLNRFVSHLNCTL